MRSLNALIWRNLTAHALRSILTALAITLGVAMVLAASIVGQAAGRSASALSAQGPQVDLEVFSRDDTPFDESVLDTLRASPDVERVSPSLRVEAELVLSTVEGGVDPQIGELTLLGVDPESYAAIHAPELVGGTFLDEPDAILVKGERSDSIVLPMMVAIDNGLNVGDEVTLAADGQKATLTVAGRLKLERDITTLIEETVAYVPLNVAQSLARAPGKIGHVEIALHPTTDGDRARVDLARRVGAGLAVVRAAVDGGAVTLTDSLVQLGLAVVGVMMLFAAAFVIMNAFAMSVTARTQEIGALRALGMTSGWKRSGVNKRSGVMRLVLTEALVMGVTGATFGVVIGIGLAWGAMHVLGTLDEGTFIVPGWGVALSVALGVIVTLLGALRPALHASRISPLVALRSQHQTGGQTWYVRHGGCTARPIPRPCLLSRYAPGGFSIPARFVYRLRRASATKTPLAPSASNPVNTAHAGRALGAPLSGNSPTTVTSTSSYNGPTEATFRICVPGATSDRTRAVMVTWAQAPAASAPSSARMPFPSITTTPCEADALTNTNSGGKASLTTTFSAVASPALHTWMVKTTCPPGDTTAGLADLLMRIFACCEGVGSPGGSAGDVGGAPGVDVGIGVDVGAGTGVIGVKTGVGVSRAGGSGGVGVMVGVTPSGARPAATGRSSLLNEKNALASNK